MIIVIVIEPAIFNTGSYIYIRESASNRRCVVGPCTHTHTRYRDNILLKKEENELKTKRIVNEKGDKRELFPRHRRNEQSTKVALKSNYKRTIDKYQNAKQRFHILTRSLFYQSYYTSCMYFALYITLLLFSYDTIVKSYE